MCCLPALSVRPSAQPGLLQGHHCTAQLFCLWFLLLVTPASFNPTCQTQPGARPGLLHWRDLRSSASGRQCGLHCRRRQVGFALASFLHWPAFALVLVGIGAGRQWGLNRRRRQASVVGLLPLYCLPMPPVRQSVSRCGAFAHVPILAGACFHGHAACPPSNSPARMGT